MGDRLLLEDVRFYGHHGVSKAEQAVGVWFSVDAELAVDLTPAAVSDDLASAVDYGVVARRIVEIGTQGRVNLIERLAGQIAQALLREFPAQQVRVRVRKLTPPHAGAGRHARSSSWSGRADAARLPLARLEPRRPAGAPARGRAAPAERRSGAGGRLAALRVGALGGGAGPDGSRAALVPELCARDRDGAAAANPARSPAGDRGRAGPHAHARTHAGGAAVHARTVDIDIIFYGDEVISVPDDMHVPHLLAAERAFVLRPLADIAPELTHPTLYRLVRELLDRARRRA